MNDLLAQGAERGLDRHGRAALREALHQALDALRARWHGSRSAGDPPEPITPAFWQQVEAILAVTPALSLRRAVNATGVVLHTGLGRAPWPQEAAAAAVAAARYAVLEIDPESGERGLRDAALAARLCALTGAEAALAANNNAGATLLALAGVARGRKVLLARGEMVEIGGAYRMPEVIAAAGARLVEVGTTNRVRPEDYARHLDDPEVACVLKVHPSNFTIGGFTSEATLASLAPACRARGIALVYDLGSGVLSGADLPPLRREPTVRSALRDGADLVTFSGDKLLGGPQAGLVVGAAPLIARLRRDVLMRCLRLDKAILAALEATLALHALGEEAARARIPALRLLAADVASLRARAEAFARRLQRPLAAEVVDCEGRVGSGAAPIEPLPSAGVTVTVPGLDAHALAGRLRRGDPPVFARVQDDRVLLDLRTVFPEEEERLLQALHRTSTA
ncbi:MAG: L-seryl-tRNA(Sec) selenium transferase [Planctomycetota bacterium]|nr:MAG: L-seryl-tRNA(Sec) selenium transferase [Planctomycetota bacterium]